MRLNRILYISMFFLSLAFIYFFGGKVPYMFFYTVVILPFISFLYAGAVYFRLKVVQRVDRAVAVKGDKINLTVTISNRGLLLYPYAKVKFGGEEAVFGQQIEPKSFSVPPFSSKSFDFELNCNYRGSFEIGVKSVEIQDFLGIFKLSRRNLSPVFVDVYPKIVHIDTFRLNVDYVSEAHSVLNSRQEDMSTILDVRKYAYGDSLKKVHWKLTAKVNDLMVKNFHSTSVASATLLVDLKRNPYSAKNNVIIEDKLIEAAVAVLYYCINNWISVNLAYYDGGLVSVEATDAATFDNAYRLLAKAGFNHNIDIKDILDLYLKDNSYRTNIVIFTSNVDYSLYHGIYKSKFSGHEVSLIYVSPEELTGVRLDEAYDVLSFVPEIGVKAYKINISDDIKTVLESGGS